MGTTYKELFKLYDLIQSGDARSVERFLTNNSVDINVILPCKGIGVLHLSVGIEPLDKSKECTELILKHCGDPNLCTDDGITPVHIAAIWGRAENLKLLIGCGGDPSCRDLDGHSAFDYAVREQQWDVYDYLHNVVDQQDDSLGSPRSYTFELEKVLVTTDQLVAEYEPLAGEQLHNGLTQRKSDMVRDWCDKHSLVMNKLYPTILGETYLIENESVPWKSIDFTKNTNFELTNDHINLNHVKESEATFKTCLSSEVAQKDIEISGIQHLENTVDETKISSFTNHAKNRNSDLMKQRMSIYENFSLPGSPNSITHVNYNTKSSLKKKQNGASLCLEFNEKMELNESSKDHLQEDLDRALVVVQNKTNEWLSVSKCGVHMEDVKATNTRRSSASSGVSSNFSGGSILIANVEEDYKYEDRQENVVLIEKRLLVSSVVLPVDEAVDATHHDHTALSVASSLPASMEYDNNTLRAELIRLGFKPGPIQNSTRTLYLKKLHALKKNPVSITKQGKTYSVELEKSLRTDDWMKDLSPFVELENKVRADFASPNKKWREGTAKTSFTYLLLDPRLTANLPAKAGQQSQHISWVTFVNSIFYVGKGKRSRPYSHLYQALTLWKSEFTTSKDKKVQHILDIWSEKIGVVCLHIFQNVIPAEAYTYEAAMIDVLGVSNLKNLKSGNYYGVAASWPLKERKMLGMYLLYKAMLIFLSEGERQLRPDDID